MFLYLYLNFTFKSLLSCLPTEEVKRSQNLVLITVNCGRLIVTNLHDSTKIVWWAELSLFVISNIRKRYCIHTDLTSLTKMIVEFLAHQVVRYYLLYYFRTTVYMCYQWLYLHLTLNKFQQASNIPSWSKVV